MSCAHVLTSAHDARTGAKTGRSPRDKRIVKDSTSEKDVWWAAPDGQVSNGSPNYEMDERCALGDQRSALLYSLLRQLESLCACMLTTPGSGEG